MVRVIPRTPKAWISCPDAGLAEVRRAGAMLVDHDGVAYPCPELQLESAAEPAGHRTARSPANHPINAGQKIGQPELEHCFRLLDSAREADPEAAAVDRIDPPGQRMVAAAGHPRRAPRPPSALAITSARSQSLRAALDHAGEKGYVIDTINLIPKYNIPITLRNESRRATRDSRFRAEPPAKSAKTAAPAISNNLLNRN